MLSATSAFLGFGQETLPPFTGQELTFLSFNHIVVGLSKLLSVVFLLFFVVSVFFGEQARSSDR